MHLSQLLPQPLSHSPPLQVGGRVQSATSPAGYRFDTGPSLLLFPDK